MIVTTMTNNLSPLYAVSQVRLATPKVVLHITRKVSEFPSMSVECHNGSKAGGHNTLPSNSFCTNI